MESENANFTIMIVEDDEAIRRLVEERLRQWNFKVLALSEFSGVDKAILDANPNLVILDVNLPVFDGFEWCRRVRAFSKIPILMISARDSGPDTVMGLTSGADDYLPKPFSLDVLAAKVRALLRRAYDYGVAEEARLVWHDLSIDLSKGTAVRGGLARELTRNELLILSELVRAKGAIVSRDRLASSLWRDEIFVDDNTLNVNVSRVRQVLSELGLPDSIRTLKGKGYQLP